jgi:hypothetical protein
MSAVRPRLVMSAESDDLHAEFGVDMTRFPTVGHLVSWATYAPKARQSAGKSKPGTMHRQPLAGQRPRRGRHRRVSAQDLPGIALPPPGPPPR